MPILKLGDKSYRFTLGEFTNRDGMDLQKATGMTWSQFATSTDDDWTANTGLVWLLRRRDGEPDLKFDDVTFAFDDYSLGLTEEEQAMFEARTREALEQAEKAKADPTPGAAGATSQSRPRGSGRPASSRSKPGTGSKPAAT